MTTKIKYIGLFLLLATLLSTAVAVTLNVDITFTIPLYIISIILIFLDDKFINEFLKERKLNPIRIKKDK